jgi:hypothetical protein
MRGALPARKSHLAPRPDFQSQCPATLEIQRTQLAADGTLLYFVRCSTTGGDEWVVAKRYDDLSNLHGSIKKLTKAEGTEVKKLYDQLTFPAGKEKKGAKATAMAAQRNAVLTVWLSAVAAECRSIQNIRILKAVTDFFTNDGSGNQIQEPEPESQWPIPEAIPPAHGGGIAKPAVASAPPAAVVQAQAAAQVQPQPRPQPQPQPAASVPPHDVLFAGAASASAPSLDVLNVQPVPVAGYLAANDKFVAEIINLGSPEQGIHGVLALMGCSYEDEAMFLTQKDAAIEKEFMNGSATDKRNYRAVVAGTDGGGWQTATLDSLAAHPNAERATLSRHHVLALRLYTTSSFKSINDPLRQQKPNHPFAATTYWISKAIGLLRLAEPEHRRHETRIFWRGMRDLALSRQFLQKGGTELACMSATEDQDVATRFAGTTCPLMFKVVTKDFHQRGADVAFLSVYPHEKEMLYPPLTFLRLDPTAPPARQILNGVQTLVATVEPVYPGGA